MDSVAEIKSRLSIVDVVGGYTQLKKAGRNFKALCPFHTEKTPSFIISPERQFAWCYGCQTGGDIFKIVELIEGIEFREALKILADKAGVELPQNFGGGVKKEKREKLIEINEAAADFFVKKLGESADAQKYLTERRLDQKTIEKWRIGFAPAGSKNLFPQLLEQFDKKEIVEASVAGVREMGSDELYDRFHDRIMFPIQDHRGRVVAFTGRILGEGEPKYLNSAESPIFSKSAILFGWTQARDAIRERKVAIVVEGQLDVISTHAAGFENVVASSGTALTEMHLAALKNVTEQIIFCFDADTAGVDSTRRALNLAAAADISARVAVLPAEFKDPDEALAEGPQIFADALKNARTPLEFSLEVVYADANLAETATKKKIARELLTYARSLVSAVEREDFLRDLSSRLGVSETALNEELENLPTVAEPRTVKKEPEPTAAKFTPEDLLVGLALAFPKTAAAAQLEKIVFVKNENAEIWEKLVERNFTAAEKTDNETAEKLQLFASDRYSDFSDERIKKEILEIAEKLAVRSSEERKHELKTKMAAAEAAGDEKEITRLATEIQKLISE